MTRPRHASQRDANQGEIVQGLRDCGYTVIDVSAYLGWCDLFVYGLNWHTQEHEWKAFEIKTRTGKLTAGEYSFQQDHPSAVTTARTLEAALMCFGRR